MHFTTFLKEISPMAKGVLPTTIPHSAYVPLDLSSANKDLLASRAYETPQQFDTYINTYLEKNNAQVAYGGYKEDRDLYRSSNLFNPVQPEETRTIHLGVDFWCPAGTAIRTPLDGIVHSFRDNATRGNYGPTIILEHTIRDTVFYTLYGHLSIGSIATLEVGQAFSAGAQIGTLGNLMVNGGYAPHLHFQIIHTIGEYHGDYPGVSSKKNLDSFVKNCPDPLCLLSI